MQIGVLQKDYIAQLAEEIFLRKMLMLGKIKKPDFRHEAQQSFAAAEAFFETGISLSRIAMHESKEQTTGTG